AWVSTHNAIAVGDDGNVTRQLTGLAAGTKDTDAVNVAQLKAAAPAAGSGIAVSGTVISVSAGDDFIFTDGQLQLKKDGKVAADNHGVVTGGTVYQAMKDKADKATSLAGYGITDAYTRTETDDAISSALAPVAETAAKHNTTIAGKNVTVTEGTNAAGGTEYTIATADDMTLSSISITGGAKISKSGFAMNGAKITGLAEGTDDADAVTMKQLRESTSKAGSPTVLKAGRNIVLKEGKTSSGGLEYTVSTSDSPAFDTITAGSGSDKVTIGSGAVKVGGRTYVSGKGLNAGGQKITNVADGTVAKGSTDAVNGGQLWDLEQKINTGGGAGLQELDRKLTRDIREVGSRAAALAGLHPLPYDEDAPTTFNVAVGSYRGETSAAVGMSHHFTRDAMFSVGGTVGSRPMFNAGFALRLGRYDEKVVEARKRRRKETAEKNRLLGQVSAQNAQIDRQAAELAQVKRERDRDRMELEALRRRLDLLEQRLSQPAQPSRRRRNK
ncbi:MAG: YadA-like family protein, partial [Pyramidobacter sp.]|nr:YadA-like family protein [Pyramidobacter sp.]